MKFVPVGDYHIHTVFSDGRSNILEIAKAAKKRGLKEIAITDHGPRNIGTGVKNSEIYLNIKKEAKKINEEFVDFKIMVGAEANVISCNGNIDIPKDIYDNLDLLLIGLHPYALSNNINDIWNLNLLNFIFNYTGKFKTKVIEINTIALINALKKHKPFAVTHPGLKMPVDIKEVAEACVQNNVYFEINSGHNYQTIEDVKTADMQGIKFIVNSDSHFKDTVGDLDLGLNILEQAGISSEKIVNILH